VSEVEADDQGGPDQVTVTLCNAPLDGVCGHADRPSKLDIDQAGGGRALTVYRVGLDAAGIQVHSVLLEGTVAGGLSASTTEAELIGTTGGYLAAAPGGNVCSSICRWAELGDADCGYQGSATECARTLRACQEMVHGPVREAGAGLEDLETRGAYSGGEGPELQHEHRLVVCADGASFDWESYRVVLSPLTPHDEALELESATQAVAMTGTWQELDCNVEVRWPSVAGYEPGASWTVRASNEPRFGNAPLAPVPGTKVEIAGHVATVSDSKLHLYVWANHRRTHPRIKGPPRGSLASVTLPGSTPRTPDGRR